MPKDNKVKLLWTGLKLFLAGIVAGLVMAIPYMIASALTIGLLQSPMAFGIFYIILLVPYFIVYAWIVIKWSKWIFGKKV